MKATVMGRSNFLFLRGIFELDASRQVLPPALDLLHVLVGNWLAVGLAATVGVVP